MIKEILEAKALADGYPFTHARKDFQNLFDDLENDGIPHVFLDPVILDDKHDDQGTVEAITNSGSFMLLVSSDLDEVSYKYRYDNYIKRMIDVIAPDVKSYIKCNSNVTFNTWRITEVINLMDQNFDGIIIEYNIDFEI